MLATHPQNAKVLAFLAERSSGSPVVVAPDAVPNAYFACGCHPDIVERLWDQLGKTLPADCRCVVHGTPALAHPQTGVILGVGIGTAYGLWLSGEASVEAARAGVTASTTWSSGDIMHIDSELGEGWVFGAWLASESNWCSSAYAAAQSAA